MLGALRSPGWCWPRVALLGAVLGGSGACVGALGVDDVTYLRGAPDASGPDASEASSNLQDARPESPTDGNGGYLDEVLADGPEVYLRLEDAPGANVALDESPHRRNARVVGQIGFGAQGIAGAAAAFSDADGGVLDLGAVFDFTNTDPYTLETWFYPEANDTQYRHLFTKGYTDPSTGREEYSLLYRQGSLVFQRYVQGADVNAQYQANALQLWIHVAVVYDGLELSLFVNGVQSAAAQDTRAQRAKPAPFYVGAADPTTGVVAGRLDEVAVYAKALPGSRIKAHYEAGLGLRSDR